MPKSKTYKSTSEGLVSVVIPGHSIVALTPGGQHETDDPVVIAAFDANPDLEEVKGSKASSKK